MSDDKINFPGYGRLNVAELGKLPTSQLVELYNAKAPKAITSTPTKSKFIPKVWDIYAQLSKPAGAHKVPDAAKPVAADSTPKIKATKPDGVGRRAASLTFPASPVDQRKFANRGSRIEQLLLMASSKKGVTEEEFKKASKAKDRFRAMLKWCSEGLGYGFKETETGRVILVDGAGHAMEYAPRPEGQKTETAAG